MRNNTLKRVIFCITLFGIIALLASCGEWDSWEQILKNKETPESQTDLQEKAEPSEPKLEPLLKSGEYTLAAPKANVSFIVFVPNDYNPKLSYPIIFCYHGAGGSATTWPFRQVTHDKGYIVVGMNYTSRAAEHLSLELIRYEKAFFLEALDMVSARINVNQNLIFMGGYSQGGYATSMVGERMLDKLAGLIILGAGRYAVDRYPPSLRSIKGEPIFVGAGQNDSVHNPRARFAANYYQGLRADVTFEEWEGVGHGINTPQFPSKILLDWLNNIVKLQIAKEQTNAK